MRKFIALLSLLVLSLVTVKAIGPDPPGSLLINAQPEFIVSAPENPGQVAFEMAEEWIPASSYIIIQPVARAGVLADQPEMFVMPWIKIALYQQLETFISENPFNGFWQHFY